MGIVDHADLLTFKFGTLTTSAVSGAASLATADWTMGVFGVPLSVFLAAFAGALVSLSFLPPPATGADRTKTVLGMVGHVGSGTCLGVFSEPLVWYGINNYLKPGTPLPETLHLGIAGLLGALVMLLLPIGVNWIKKITGATQ